MSETSPSNSQWKSPTVIIAVLGMLGTAVGSYTAFQSRIADFDRRIAVLEDRSRIEEGSAKMASIDRKLDKLLTERAQ